MARDAPSAEDAIVEVVAIPRETWIAREKVVDRQTTPRLRSSATSLRLAAKARQVPVVWSRLSRLSSWRRKFSPLLRHDFLDTRGARAHTPWCALAMAPSPPSFKTVVVEVDRDAGVGTLRLNRPRKSNAIDPDMWLEIPRALAWLDQDEDVRAVVLCAAGKNFCAGIDVSSPSSSKSSSGRRRARRESRSCAGREAEAMYRHVRRLQESFTAVERCRAPVVCAVQSACFGGGGVDLAAACDVRVCARDAVFCVKEVDLAIVADIGTLQRLPALIGHGRALEMALTARPVRAEEGVERRTRDERSRERRRAPDVRACARGDARLGSRRSRRKGTRRRVCTRGTTPCARAWSSSRTSTRRGCGAPTSPKRRARDSSGARRGSPSCEYDAFLFGKTSYYRTHETHEMTHLSLSLDYTSTMGCLVAN